MFGLGGELLGELVVNPDGSRTFTDWYWLNSLPVAQHVRVLNTAGNQVSDARTYLYPDHLDTPRLVTNAACQVIWRLDTDPFGDGTVSEIRMARMCWKSCAAGSGAVLRSRSRGRLPLLQGIRSGDGAVYTGGSD